MTQWSEPTPEVINIAQEIIKVYHHALTDAEIAFNFRSEPGKSQGQPVHAQASKVPVKFNALGISAHFLIWIAEPTWNDLTTNQRYALIDHQLFYCRFDCNGASLAGDGFEEFIEIIERYGFWNAGLFKGVPPLNGASQLELLPDKSKGQVTSLDPASMEWITNEELTNPNPRNPL